MARRRGYGGRRARRTGGHTPRRFVQVLYHRRHAFEYTAVLFQAAQLDLIQEELCTIVGGVLVLGDQRGFLLGMEFGWDAGGAAAGVHADGADRCRGGLDRGGGS